MITQNLFNKKTKAETKAYNPFGSNVKLVGDNITEKDYYDFIEGFSDPYGEKGINNSPASTDFGDFAKANYPYMQYLLGLEEELA